jgi:transposase
MIRVREGISIYVSSQPIDGRKAIDGLAAFVIEAFGEDLRNGSLYVFFNKDKDRIKCLFWDKNGFVLYHKRLERGKFKLSTSESSCCYSITPNQLDWLLAGLDFTLMQEFSELDYTHYF